MINFEDHVENFIPILSLQLTYYQVRRYARKQYIFFLTRYLITFDI